MPTGLNITIYDDSGQKQIVDDKQLALINLFDM